MWVHQLVGKMTCGSQAHWRSFEQIMAYFLVETRGDKSRKSGNDIAMVHEAVKSTGTSGRKHLEAT